MFSPVLVFALRNAKKLAEEGFIGEACEAYLFAYALDSSTRIGTKEFFLCLFREWCRKLEEEERYKDLFIFYGKALEVLPDEVEILNDLGSLLLKHDKLDEAAVRFRKCLSIDEDYLRAARNLENISILQVERWHFKMLNDRNRNEAYKEAIIKKIKQGFDRVLDVGTGTGLLSLFCLEGKAKEVYACDSSPKMLEIAKNVLLSNALGKGVKLIPKHSSDLKIPEDIAERVSLLVTETFDVGLLGEHILSTLTHAWEHLLLPLQPQNEASEPGKFGTVVPYKAVVYITGTQFDKVANDFHLKRTSTSNLFVDWNVLQLCDDYDCHDLSRAQCKFLTETEKVFEINFNDPGALLEFTKGWNKNMTLKCKSQGRLDCFALWYDLHLDEDIVLSTSPSRANIAWDQAVFLLPRSVFVKEEQNVKIVVSFEATNLKITLSDYNIDKPNFVASDDVIKILNNEELAKELHQVVNELAPLYDKSVSILDCYPFPVFGLNFLRSRSDRFKDELICFVPKEDDQKLVRCMAEKYDLSIDALVKKKTNFETDYLIDKKFDIILLDLIKMNGEIADDVLLLFDFLHSLLKPGGIILPERVTVIGQFIYSDWLDKVSGVIDDSVTFGYNIANHINEYKVQNFIDFDYKTIDSIPCSEPFELFDLLDRSVTTGESPICLQSITAGEVDSQSSAEFLNAMVYWFKIRFLENSEGYLTLNDPFCRQAARLFPKTFLCNPNKYSVIRNDGLFDVNFKRINIYV